LIGRGGCALIRNMLEAAIKRTFKLSAAIIAAVPMPPSHPQLPSGDWTLRGKAFRSSWMFSTDRNSLKTRIIGRSRSNWHR